MRKSTHLIVATIALLAIGFTGAYSTMSQKPLDKQWVELFKSKSDVITKYAETHPIHISDQVIDHQDMSDSTIPNAIFTNTEWINGSTAIDSHFINAKFIGGSMTNTGLSRSTFTNVIFENMTFNNVEFIGSTFINTTFKNCKIYNSELHNLKPSTFTIEDSELNRVNFFQSAMDLTLKNSRVIELGDFSGLVAGSKVTLDHSYIGPYSDFTFQKGLISFTAKNSDLKGFAFGGTIGTVTLTDSILDDDLTLGSANIDRLDVKGCDIKQLTHGNATIHHVTITDCKQSHRLSFITSTIGDFSLRNCDIGSFALWDSTINQVTINNVKLGKVQNQGLKAKEFTLQNVIFDGETDFKGAMADKTSITNVTFGASSSLNAAGSNIPLKR